MENIKMSSTDGEKMAGLFTAFSDAQAGINNVLADKDMMNKFKYAELHQLLSAIRAPFAKNGLAVMQFPNGKKADNVTHDYLTTIITHKSGEWISGTMVLPLVVENRGTSAAQAFGASITYARRYMLAAIVGIAQVDDESYLIPDVKLSIERGEFDLDTIRSSGIKEAKKGRPALTKWYSMQSIDIKDYLSKNDAGKELMTEISSNIPTDGDFVC